MKGISIAGRKLDDGIDLYETPVWATKELLKRESFSGGVLEPACGFGAISEVLKETGYNVKSQDLVDRGYGDGNIDFLNSALEGVDNIITNPPYKYAQKFVEVSKMVASKKIAMILKLSFLESAERYKMLHDKEFPLKVVYVFCKRVNMYPHGVEKPKNSGTIAYAWYVWDKEYVGDPIIKWILGSEKV